MNKYFSGQRDQREESTFLLLPACVFTAVALVLEAHAEEDDDECSAPADSGVLIRQIHSSLNS